MSKDKQPEQPRIDIEMYYHPEDPSKIGFMIERADGQAITSQIIIDAVSDCLIEHFNFIPEIDMGDNQDLQ